MNAVHGKHNVPYLHVLHLILELDFEKLRSNEWCDSDTMVSTIGSKIIKKLISWPNILHGILSKNNDQVHILYAYTDTCTYSIETAVHFSRPIFLDLEYIQVNLNFRLHSLLTIAQFYKRPRKRNITREIDVNWKSSNSRNKLYCYFE